MREKFERFSKYMEYSGLNDNKVTVQCGLSQGLLGQARAGKSDLGAKTIDKILKKYQDINRVWLLTGEGEMIKKAPEGNAKMVDVSGMQIMQVPVVPVHAQAGFLSGYGDAEYIDSLPTMAIPVDTNYQGKYFVFVVSGDSMDDGSSNCLLDGDKVLVRELPVDYWKFKLHARKWNFWVFVTRTEGVVIKKIKEQNLDTGEITLTSLNPLYKDIHLHINDVAGIYNVVKLVERNF